MMTVYRDFAFEACHSLPHLGPDHKCARMHGHSYGVTVEVTGDLCPLTGFVVDYAEIARAFKVRVFDRLDHRNVDDVVSPSTSENLARWIYSEMSDEIRSGTVSAVTVRETAVAGCRYEP